MANLRQNITANNQKHCDRHVNSLRVFAFSSVYRWQASISVDADHAHIVWRHNCLIRQQDDVDDDAVNWCETDTDRCPSATR